MTKPADEGELRVLLEEFLPPDLPRRGAVAGGCARHLALVLEANRRLNLTRIATPRDAALKHAVDSVVPWRLLGDAQDVLDLGSGAGFPGVPLACVLPRTHFLLVESVRKKAQALGAIVAELGLPNVEVHAERAEELLRRRPVEVVTARAVGPARRLLHALRPVRDRFLRLVLYKGPEAERELAEAQAEARRLGLAGRVALRYELPRAAGSRAVLVYEPAGEAGAPG